MNDRFGMTRDMFADYLLFKKKKTYWVMKKTLLIKNVSHLKIMRLGIKAFQEVGSFIKPTTRIIQYFGHMATKAIFDINEIQLRQILEGKYIPADMSIENGYVILSLRGQILGLGLLINGEIRSQLPSKDVRFMTI